MAAGRITMDKNNEKNTAGKWIKIGVRIGLPVLLTVLLVWYMFRKVDFREMLEICRQGVDYWWIVLAMVISIFSHIFRAARWRLQLRALGVEPPFMALCCSIFGCYAMNLVFPRLGEVWRCTYVSTFHKNSFPTVLGSMLGERLADMLTVLALLLLCLVVASPAISAFMDKYPVGRDMVMLLSQWWFWVALAAAAALAWVLFLRYRHTAPMRKLMAMASDLWQGFAVVAGMKGRWSFIVYSLCIWGCYYLQLYVAFYAFDFTRALCHEPGLAFGFTPCLVAFVLSAIGMAIPSSGGLGPWNLAVMFGLSLYGISDAQGTAFSMLQWSGQTVMLILLGIFTMLYIALHRHNGLSLEKETLEETLGEA